MRVVVFRHARFEGLGLIAPQLDASGISVEFADLYRPGAALPDISNASGLIFMGGPMSANDDLPYLKQELEFIRAAVKSGQPVLGVCLGAQLIATALDARVYRNPVKEIGWFDIQFTTEGLRDRLFAGLDPTQTVFHWHGETFDLPGGAVWLAFSAGCRHQAFRFGPNVYALQFHLEVTPEMISEWCLEEANCGDVKELTTPIDPHLHAQRLAQLAAQVFRQWCGLLPASEKRAIPFI
ncbi:MAG: amidotransferase [Terriglobia bacterium]|nr:MAG: amidotransferase [Terriglobia bacterium]